MNLLGVSISLLFILILNYHFERQDTKYIGEFPKEFVTDLYNGVKSHEIRIPEEFPTGQVTNVTYEDLICRGRRSSEYVKVSGTDHDRDVSQ